MLEDPSYRIRYDEDAGPVQRPYSITDGRTQPDIALELESLVCATGDVPDRLDPMLEEVLHLCQSVAAVVEVSARLGTPIVVTKILLSDLITHGAVQKVGRTVPDSPPHLDILEAMLRGLKRLPV